MLKRLFSGLRKPDAQHVTTADPALSPQAHQAQAADVQRYTREMMTHLVRLQTRTLGDNYDELRYGHNHEWRNREDYAPVYASFICHFFEHAAALWSARMLFLDEDSRQLMDRLLLYRMLGHEHVQVLPDYDAAAQRELLQRAQALDHGPSALRMDGMSGPMRHFEGIPADHGLQLSLDGWPGNVVWTAFRRQYYFARGGTQIAPQSGDIVLDLGACLGDTTVYFAATVGDQGHVYAFDPLPAHQRVSRHNVAQNGFSERVTVVPSAVGDVDYTPQSAAPPLGDRVLPGFSMDAEEADFPVTRVDSFVQRHQLARVDFIKMDIEGFELAALEGAREVIARDRPRLAISLYHRPDDLHQNPLWLIQNFPFYRISLDHYTIHREETVLYALAA